MDAELRLKLMDRRVARGSWVRRAESKGLAVRRRHLVRGWKIADESKLRERGSGGVGVCEGDTAVERRDHLLLLGDGPGVVNSCYRRLDDLPETAQRMNCEAKLVIERRNDLKAGFRGINVRPRQGCGVFMITLAFPPAGNGIGGLREAGHGENRVSIP